MSKKYNVITIIDNLLPAILLQLNQDLFEGAEELREKMGLKNSENNETMH